MLFETNGKLTEIAKYFLQVMVEFLMIWGMVDFY